jgi:D-alanyl-D-alanine carboxypeptidase
VQAPAPSSLAADLDRIVDAPPFDRAVWGIDVEDDAGRTLYARNAGKLMIPASNRKLFSAAMVIDCLGADARLATSIWRDGDDLVVVGDGDPSLGSARYERDGDFDLIAEQLRARGITRVRDLVMDVSHFDRITVPPGWKVNYLTDAYGAPVDAIAWQENARGEHAVADPPGSALAALRDVLTLHDITVAGVSRINTAPRTWQEKLFELPSPFVAQLLTTVLKNSHNLYAEMLYKRAAGGTYEQAFATERAFLLADAHVADGSFRFMDGSGLAPDDLVAPESVVRILRWMNDPSRRGFWWTVLAQPANEGTLRRRLITLEPRLRGKTGTLASVNTLSGIIAMPDGTYRYFTILLNHHLAAEATKAVDAIAARIAER